MATKTKEEPEVCTRHDYRRIHAVLMEMEPLIDRLFEIQEELCERHDCDRMDLWDNDWVCSKFADLCNDWIETRGGVAKVLGLRAA